MSISGDKTGIAGVWITGLKKNETNDYSKELMFELAFAVSIKAPKGRQISFEKNRNFIYWLKEQNFKIKGISYDTFQSYDFGQTLMAKGYPCSIISVDKLENKICKPYQFFRSIIYEERFKIFENKLLTQEILGLERDNNTGKVDHSPNGINSKDCSDACCGAVYNASQHGEEYEFEFGEDLDIIVNSNLEPSKEQIMIDLKEEINKIFDPIANQKNKIDEDSKSFIAINDGILLW